VASGVGACTAAGAVTGAAGCAWSAAGACTGLGVIGRRQIGDLRLRWADHRAFGNIRRLGDLGGYRASCNGRRAVLRRFKALLDGAAKIAAWPFNGSSSRAILLVDAAW
jgi:hypothetical protein